jgi:hypothetical protein
LDLLSASLILIVGLEKVKPERFIETWSAASSILIEEDGLVIVAFQIFVQD